MNKDESSKTSVTHLAGYSLEQLLALYKSDLHQKYLPYLDQNVYDHDSGGFMCHIDRDAHHPTTNKRTWYDGRGVWVYAHLYHHLDQNPKYLERASQTIGFLMDIESRDYPYWPWGYTRSGLPLEGHKADIYGSLFVAEGLAAMAIATDQEEYWEKAVRLLEGCLSQYDDPQYEYIPHFKANERLEAPRVLGHWMILLNLTSHLQEYKTSDYLRAISDRCIEALLKHHFHPDFELMIEYLHHDFRKPDAPMDQFAYLGHGIEVLWMIMEVAQRRQDAELWERTSNLFKRHVEVAWDDVYGGILHELTHVGENNWLLEKVLWAQEEVLIGLMMLIESREDEWAIRWFDKVYPYVRKEFILHDHPHQLWINGGNRKMDVHHQVDRFENYHHPRHLMKNIMALERIIGRSHTSDIH